MCICVRALVWAWSFGCRPTAMAYLAFMHFFAHIQMPVMSMSPVRILQHRQKLSQRLLLLLRQRPQIKWTFGNLCDVNYVESLASLIYRTKLQSTTFFQFIDGLSQLANRHSATDAVCCSQQCHGQPTTGGPFGRKSTIGRFESESPSHAGRWPSPDIGNPLTSHANGSYATWRSLTAGALDQLTIKWQYTSCK